MERMLNCYSNRAMYAIEYGERMRNPGIVEAGRKVLAMLQAGESVIRSDAYKIVLRVWHR